MKIRKVQANWVHVPIPYESQHISDFGRVSSFDAVIVRIETTCGIVGWGEAKEEVGSASNCSALTSLINQRIGPSLVGEDPRDINRLAETIYNGSRAHYALREGHVFPILGRRGITVAGMSFGALSANAKEAINRLLELGVLPIVNENDTVATDEIRVGDNDTLGSLVTNLIEADVLVIDRKSVV